MATYVNDLRLKEIATGDESGTWGTSTNTNLELIGEALGYNTQDCFSSDADATTTVADGSSDPARAMYFKVTSSATLSATRTLTIGPNTISRVMFIENATTGSQSIAISQGSGANVTIATGKTAVVYLDGAGSGAAVVDAMLKVDPGVTDTLAEVLVAGNTSGGTSLVISSGDDLTLTGASSNAVWDSSANALAFADASKAVFGAGNDLEIFHNASNSIINDNGTGTLQLQTGGATKLEVTSSGVTVSGTITGTLATAAQANVTSVGTLTSLAVSGDLTIDTNTLKVNSTTNRVGVLNASPDVSLDVGSATDAIHMPVGTTAQRPTGAAGYLRYNSTLEQFEGYTDDWGQIGGGGGSNTFATNSFTGNGSTTAYALSQVVTSEDNLLVFIEGVFQQQAAYSIATASGTTTLTFASAPANGRSILIYSVASAISGTNLNSDTMTGDGSDTTLTLSLAPVNENNTQVYIDGTYQHKDTYSISGTTLTFSTAPPLGTAVEVMTMNQLDVNTPTDGSVTSDKLSGALVTPSSLTVTGDLITTTSGTSNFVAGVNAGNSIASGGNYNVAVGDEAGTAITTGDDNVAIGYAALDALSSGSRSVAIGSGALTALTATGNAYNTAVGYLAGTAATTGIRNNFFGAEAGEALTEGTDNIAIGYQTLTADTLGSRSVAIGNNALDAQNFTSATNTYNTAVGYAAGGAVTTGVQNTLIGGLAGDAITTAANNTAVGYASLGANTTGERNIAIGTSALDANTTADSNISIGVSSLTTNTTGASNVAIGDQALSDNTTASNNTAVGYHSLLANTTGTPNVAVGANALDANTTGGSNIAVGFESLTANTTGNFNTALGRGALAANVTAHRSVAVGYNTLANSNVSGNSNLYNTAVGYGAGGAVTDGLQNTLIGGLTGDSITGGDNNTAVGQGALGSETTGGRSVAIGAGALSAQNFTGNELPYNVAVGLNAGASITTGTSNTLIGGLCGDNLTTGDLCTKIGFNLQESAVGVDNEIMMGTNITGAGANTIRLGTAAGNATLNFDGSDTSWAAASDERLKEDVTTSTAGLSFIQDLRPITYKWKAKNAVADTLPQYDADSTDPVYGSGKTQHGFIAQEVKTAIDAHSEIKNGFSMWVQDPDGTQQVAPSALVPMLVKAIQEQQALITAQATAITDLTTRLTALENN